MKNFNAKSFISGLLIGSICITTVFATGGIKSAKYKDSKVYFNNSIIPLENSVVSIVKEGENDSRIYIPAKEILEHLGYDVKWNVSEPSIKISTKTPGLNQANILTPVPHQNTIINGDKTNEIDKKALDIMQKTGNWEYVKPFFPSMSPEGLASVANLYIQKTGNYEQAQEAMQYINNFATESKTQLNYDVLASQAMEKTEDIYSIMVYIPHMSTAKVDTLVKDYIDKTNNFPCIYSIRQYMSTEGIDNTVKSYVDRTGDYGIVVSILQFMSADASDYVAKKYINESNESKDQNLLKFFIQYLKN